MKRSEINDYIRKNFKNQSDEQLSRKTGLSANAVRHRRRSFGLHRDPVIVPDATPIEQIEKETELQRQAREQKAATTKYKTLLDELSRTKQERDAALSIRHAEISSFEIKPIKGKGGEATMVAVASDWHLEEHVDPKTVNGLNEHNLEISKARAEKFFATLVRLIEIEKQNTTVNKLILALLGDFISNDIHDEFLETALLQPMDAILRAQEYIVSGIDFILANTDVDILAVCHSGNHARTTKQVRASTEAGHSLEYMMYSNLAMHYKGNKRITFMVPPSYLSYVDVYGTTICFHHGHNVKYGGGVGGITISMNKAIAQWNRNKHADIYVCGHFHQVFDGGNFIVNGSQIGFNPFAVAIKAAYERPAQVVFGVHSKHGKYVTRSIFPEV